MSLRLSWFCDRCGRSEETRALTMPLGWRVMSVPAGANDYCPGCVPTVEQERAASAPADDDGEEDYDPSARWRWHDQWRGYVDDQSPEDEAERGD